MTWKLVRGATAAAVVCIACGDSAALDAGGEAGTNGEAGPAIGADGGHGASAGGSGDPGGGAGESGAGESGADESGADESGAGESGAGGSGAGGSGAGGSGAGGSGAGGSGAGGSGMAGTGGIPLADGPIEIARMLCDKLFNCCSEVELAALPQNLGQSEGACQLAAAIYLTLVAQASEESLAAGRIRYDGVALSECLTRYGTEDCSVLRTLDLSSCPDVFAPQVELGGACGISADCNGGYCEGANDGATPVGECVAKKATGEECAAPAECQSGLCDTGGAGCQAAVDSPLCGS